MDGFGKWWVVFAHNVMLRSINPLAPERSECDSKNGLFNLVLLIGIIRSFHDNALWWMPQDLTDDKSTLVQVMAWCRQATSHYLSQCWLSPLSPYGFARPQCVIWFRCTLAYNKCSWFCFTFEWFNNKTVLLYGPCMIVPHKWTKICWLATAN